MSKEQRQPYRTPEEIVNDRLSSIEHRINRLWSEIFYAKTVKMKDDKATPKILLKGRVDEIERKLNKHIGSK